MKIRLVAIFEGVEFEDIVYIHDEDVAKKDDEDLKEHIEELAREFAFNHLEYFGEIIEKGENQ